MKRQLNVYVPLSIVADFVSRLTLTFSSLANAFFMMVAGLTGMMHDAVMPGADMLLE